VELYGIEESPRCSASGHRRRGPNALAEVDRQPSLQRSMSTQQVAKQGGARGEPPLRAIGTMRGQDPSALRYDAPASDEDAPSAAFIAFRASATR
jgi:hypothetical protein